MRVEVPTDIIRRLRDDVVAARRREIGGILMAEQLEPGVFRIADFSVDSESGSEAHFVRSPEHHREALTTFFKKTAFEYDKFNYLGEWHSHPNHPALPSPTDMSAMQLLVDGERQIDFAILLIVKVNWLFQLKCCALLFQKGSQPSKVKLVEVTGRKIRWI